MGNLVQNIAARGEESHRCRQATQAPLKGKINNPAQMIS